MTNQQIAEGVKLRRINYESLNGKQKEIYNFQKSAAVLADYGFNCIKLTDDWCGADFLACHKESRRSGFSSRRESRSTRNTKGWDCG